MTNDTNGQALSIRLRLICETPPPAVHEGQPTVFGLQDKQQSVDTGRPEPDGSILYECSVRVRRLAGEDHLRFSGPCTHGPSGDAFLYLSWRSESGTASWIRRLKVPLRSITWEQVVAASETQGGLIEGRVAGTGSARTSLLRGGWEVRAG